MEAIYARQSLDKKDSLSIESQIELCRKQASQEVTIYRDKGFSGKDTNRPAFEALMADVQRGAITKILVYRLDRFSRSIADFGRVWELLERHSVAFESVSEKFDTTTPMGRAMLNIIMIFAQLERETIAERVKVNYYHRHSLGAWPGGPPPIGYDIGRLTGDDGRAIPTLVPNERMDVVKDLFRRYSLSDISLGEVARQLNQEGIEGVRRANWDTVRVARILKNPVYVMADEAVYWYYKGRGLEIAQPVEAFTGIHACNLVGKRDGKTRKHQPSSQKLSLANHVGCIHAELFLQCQYKLDHNQPLDRTSAGRHSWLTGLLKCKSCGYAAKLNRQQDKVFLLCSGRSNLQVCNESFSVDIRALEQSVQGEMERLIKACPPEELRAVEQDRLTDSVQAIDLKIERLLAALSEGGDVTARYIGREIERLDQERSVLMEEQRAARIRRRANDLAELQFTALSFEEKKIAAAFFVEKILLSGDTAEVFWRI
jgi:DNA invertase Pin-like site-specific DNA recombinase